MFASLAYREINVWKPIDSEGHLYGIPIAHQTMALCYNKSLVEKPATTLSEWLEQAKNGTSIAIEPSFLNTFPISDRYNTDRLRFYGDRFYTRVLQGEILPTVGAKNILKRINHSPPDEAIVVSASASSNEVQEQVVVDVKPNLEYLWQLFRIQGEILKRPYIFWQLFFVIVILSIAWRINRPLTRWIKNVLTRWLG